VRVEDLGGFENADLFKLLRTEVFKIIVGHMPERICVVTEVLEADPDLAGLCEIGAPVVEDLQPAYQHIGLLDIDPRVLEQTAIGFGDSKAIDEDADGDEVAVDKAIGDLTNVGRYRCIDSVDEFAHRHRGKEVVTGESLPFAGLIDGFDGENAIALGVDAIDLESCMDLAAFADDLAGDVLHSCPGPNLG